jgi:hypothetical protein
MSAIDPAIVQAVLAMREAAASPRLTVTQVAEEIVAEAYAALAGGTTD